MDGGRRRGVVNGEVDGGGPGRSIRKSPRGSIPGRRLAGHGAGRVALTGDDAPAFSIAPDAFRRRALSFAGRA